MDKPFHVYGSIQDHGSRRGIVDLSRGRDQIPTVEFTSAPGGEGCSHAVDPTNPNIVYSAGFYGRIQRSELVNGQWKTVSIVPKVKKGEPPLRGQWRAPFIISPHNPRIIYHGMQYLFRSMNRGDSWERISPDLTYNDKNEMGDIPYHTIFAISESPLKFGLIYVGTDDGKVHITKDGGIHWTEIMEGLPYRKWVSSICASAFDEGTVYMSQNGKRDDDFAASLWKSTDYGKTWIDISNNIPCGPINVIKEDPKNKNVLYVGTDIGAYVSENGGKTWHILGGNLPSTFVHDLIIHPRDDILVIATHGRGMFAMDVRYLQKLTEEILSKDVHLFKIEPAKLPRWRGRGKINGIINYYLKEPQKVSITITDKSDKTIKELKATGDAGLNVVIWDLTTNENKFVKPGIYNVKISAGTVKLEEKIEVKKFSL